MFTATVFEKIEYNAVEGKNPQKMATQNVVFLEPEKFLVPDGKEVVKRLEGGIKLGQSLHLRHWRLL